jgi:LPS-assembly lipoprotein
MSSFDRRAALFGLMALAGCGFAPVYAPGGQGAALRGAIRAADPVTRADQQFLIAFEERLGRPNAAPLTLSYTIAQDRTGAGRIDGLGPSRMTVQGRLAYSLRRGETEVARGQVAASSSYSTTSTQLATLTAAEDAEARLMVLLADALVARLLIEPGLAP